MARKQLQWRTEITGLTVSFHQPLVPETLWPLVELAVKSSDVLEALRHFRHKDSWDEIYRAFEIVEGEVGGGIHRSGWATRGELDRFTHTADTMRHAKKRKKKKTVAPQDPMSLTDARELVRRILKAWIELKHQTARA